MKSKLLHDKDELKSFALVFEKDEEINDPLLRFAAENGLRGAQVTAIGAFAEATLGFFRREKSSYDQIPLKEQVEVLSFTGNIAEKDGKPMLHAHVVVGKSDGTAWGGHFLQGRVWPTLEMIVSEMPVRLHRKHDEETGLALIDLST